MRVKILGSLIIAMILMSCTSEKKETLPLGIRKFVSQEVLQTSSYTYIKGIETEKEIWLAVRKRNVEIGKTFYYNENKALEMHDFKSKELDRVFHSILFLDNVMDTKDNKNTTSKSNTANKSAFVKKKVEIKSNEGTITIAQVFENKEKLSGKTITIKAEVTKFTPNIMGRNWIHIQDGSEYNSKYDLTVTTKEEVAVGSIISIKGKLSINKDFGAGYSYECILEEASVKI